jgi:hypothetical protein
VYVKLTLPIPSLSSQQILEEARSQNLETAVVVSQGNTGEIIRQFEDGDESEGELRHKGFEQDLIWSEDGCDRPNLSKFGATFRERDRSDP